MTPESPPAQGDTLAAVVAELRAVSAALDIPEFGTLGIGLSDYADRIERIASTNGQVTEEMVDAAMPWVKNLQWQSRTIDKRNSVRDAIEAAERARGPRRKPTELEVERMDAEIAQEADRLEKLAAVPVGVTEAQALAVAAAIMSDIDGRSGMDMDFDEEVMEEIRTDFAAIVRKTLAQPSGAGKSGESK